MWRLAFIGVIMACWFMIPAYVVWKFKIHSVLRLRGAQ